ncbi:Signal transduction histidine kinase [Gordonia malaquae]|uniref:histidine kinase n=1 Tax=Gordonia malaquae NBRC 108250 TaxID=1223542 RepID=M3TIP4_GORML|nr:HAMP domain-containing sensor histidine kinase [Gordonia malaquae]GAC81391.1 putative two-component histidine kinase [Gordonia malaquae NBRC 108250]SED74130.1 Signal transduction histidine kinase [Gordonia malaquae]
MNRAGFGTRLFLASSLVVIGCVATAAVVSVLIAPGLFHEHLQQAGIEEDSGLAAHIEMAFRGTLVPAWGIAALVAVLIALAVSWWLARRVDRSVGALAESAGDIARGRYDTRVDDDAGLGREFADLADAVNELARRLGETESTRRRMLADLGHEMRTPIATINSHLEALEDGVRTADVDTIRVLRAGSQRLARLAEDINAVSRVQEGLDPIRPERTTTGALVTAAVTAASAAYRDAGLDLQVDTDPDIVLTVDPARIGQVLGNLLDNARRHTPRGGSVTLRTVRAGDGVVVTVSDSGEGIDPEHLPHVFDRFYRADTARSSRDGGSGIGLTIVAALVQAHGGTVSAASAGRGTGAVFTVTLPTAGPSEGSANLDA